MITQFRTVTRWALLLALGSMAAGTALAQVTTLPPGFALPTTAGDTTKPGFIWRVHQSLVDQATTNERADRQLQGLVGPNLADPSATGGADGPSTAPNPENAAIAFDVSAVINFSQTEGDANGRFMPDLAMPGIPGLESGNNGIAAEVLTWLQLPAGDTIMAVNSDDGFRLTMGGASPTDQFAVTVGEFNGGRGAADTQFTVRVAQAGVYAARLLWQEGGGGANVEWWTVKADGTRVLVNDTAGGGIRAFRAVSGGSAPLATKVVPGPAAVGVFPNAAIEVDLLDGGSPVTTASVKMTLDGAAVAATVTKTGSTTSVRYQPSTLFAAASSHTITLDYTAGAASYVNSWSFTVENYGTIAAKYKVVPDASKLGFLWRVHQVSGPDQATSNARAESQLAGDLRDADGNILANIADPNARGPALAAAAAANPANAPIQFEVPGVINFAQNAGESNGRFVPDLAMPGIPGTEGGNNSIAAEIITYLELPAGVTVMAVNSDDGFRTQGNNVQDAFESTQLGQFDAGRGASDTVFSFVVAEAGVYPFRTIWNEGGGGANIEWWTLKADGTRVLVNDTANGGLKAYRATTTQLPPVVKRVSPEPAVRQLNTTASEVRVVLADGTVAVDQNSIVLQIDGKPVTTTVTRSGTQVTAIYTPSSVRIPSEKYRAKLTYTGGGGSFSRTVEWTFLNLKALILPAAAVTENFDSYQEGEQPAGYTFWNFSTDTDGADVDSSMDFQSQSSDYFKNWAVVDEATAPLLDGGSVNVAPGQTFNGQPVTSIFSGRLLYAESDGRSGSQVQFVITKPFNLSALTKGVVMTIGVGYEQNQDNVGIIEYSVDAGTTWLPVVIYLDQADGGGDIVFNADGTVDAVTTLSRGSRGTGTWPEGLPSGSYGAGLGGPITAALGDYIVPRINDNNVEGNRVEVFRLPAATGKSDVRLRLAQLGTDSWWFLVDNIAFYDIEGAAPAQPSFNAPTLAGGNLTLSWTGSGTLQSADSVTGPWAPAASQANPQTVPASGAGKFYRISQ